MRLWVYAAIGLASGIAAGVVTPEGWAAGDRSLLAMALALATLAVVGLVRWGVATWDRRTDG